MLLQGSIQRFNLASVLQFLAQGEVTGILEVRDFDEYGFIYLVHGRVEGISLPVTDEKLGTRLVRAGLLTEKALAEVLMEETLMSKEQKRVKPLGQRLIDRGLLDENAIREIMARQTMDQIFALAQWQNGVFIFDEPDQMPQFKVAISANVQGLLLEAYRRIDEGEKTRVEKKAVANEVCFACPLDEECDNTIKAKYLKKDVCLWREMGAVIDEDYEKVRDARRLYKSRETAARPELTAALDSDGTHGAGDLDR